MNPAIKDTVEVALGLAELSYKWEQKYLSDNKDVKNVECVGDNNLYNTRLLVAESKREDTNTIYIACKGTEFEKIPTKEKKQLLKDYVHKIAQSLEHTHHGVQDLLTDFSFQLVAFPDFVGVSGHAGFYQAAESVLQDLLLKIERLINPGTAIVFTGHSLGGAVASVLTLLVDAELRKRGKTDFNVALITFGSPHVGNRSFAQAVAAVASVNLRYASALDMVPKLLKLFPEFEHVCPKAEMSEHWLRLLADSAVHTFEALEGSYGISKLGAASISNLLRAHSLAEYRRSLFGNTSVFMPLIKLGLHGVRAGLTESAETVKESVLSSIKSKLLMSKPTALAAAVIPQAAGTAVAAAINPLSLVAAGASVIGAAASVYTAVQVTYMQGELKLVKNMVSDLHTGVDAIQCNQRELQYSAALLQLSLDKVGDNVDQLARENAAYHQKTAESLEWLGQNLQDNHTEMLSVLCLNHAECVRQFEQTQSLQISLVSAAQQNILQSIHLNTDQIIKTVLEASTTVTGHILNQARIEAVNSNQRRRDNWIVKVSMWESFYNGERVGALTTAHIDAMHECIRQQLQDLVRCMAYVESRDAVDYLLHIQLTLLITIRTVSVFMLSSTREELKVREETSKFVSSLHELIGRVVFVVVTRSAGVVPPLVHAIVGYFCAMLSLSQCEASAMSAMYASQVQSNARCLELSLALDPTGFRANAIRLHSFAYQLDSAGGFCAMDSEARSAALLDLLAARRDQWTREDVAIVLDASVEMRDARLILFAATALLECSFHDVDAEIMCTVDIAQPLFSVSWDLKDTAQKLIYNALQILADTLTFDRLRVSFSPQSTISGDELSIASQQLICCLDRVCGLTVHTSAVVKELSRAILATDCIAPCFLEVVNHHSVSPLALLDAGDAMRARDVVLPTVCAELKKRFKAELDYHDDHHSLSVCSVHPHEAFLDDSIVAFSHVHDLTLELGLASIPCCIRAFVHLTSLSLNNNRLLELPVEIGYLTTLKILTVRENKLSTLPESIANLSNLQTLDLSLNDIVNLPASMCGMQGVHVIVVGNTGISQDAKDLLHKLAARV